MDYCRAATVAAWASVPDTHFNASLLASKGFGGGAAFMGR